MYIRKHVYRFVEFLLRINVCSVLRCEVAVYSLMHHQNTPDCVYGVMKIMFTEPCHDYVIGENALMFVTLVVFI